MGIQIGVSHHQSCVFKQLSLDSLICHMMRRFFRSFNTRIRPREWVKPAHIQLPMSAQPHHKYAGSDRAINQQHIRLNMTFHIAGQATIPDLQPMRIAFYRHSPIFRQMIIQQIVNRFGQRGLIPTQPFNIHVKPVSSTRLDHSASAFFIAPRTLARNSRLDANRRTPVGKSSPSRTVLSRRATVLKRDDIIRFARRSITKLLM